MRLHVTAILMFLTAALALADDHTPPKLVCDDPTYDFGSVQDSVNVEHTFVLKNEGGRALSISRVRPACGCTTAALTSNTIAPGQSVELAASLSTKGRRGPQQKAIYVESDDPATPQLTLQLKGTIQQILDCRPMQAVLQVSRDTPNPRVDVQITFSTPEPHSLMLPKSTEPTFWTSELKEVRPGYEYTLSVGLKDGLDPKTSYDSAVISLNTDYKEQPVLQVPVVLMVQRDVIVAPNQLLLQTNGKVALPFVQQILVRNRTPDSITITGVDTPGSTVQATTNKLTDAMYRIELTFHELGQDLNNKIVTIHVKRQGAEQEDLYDVPIRTQP